MPDTAEEIVNNSLSQLVEGSYDGLLAAGVIGDSLYGQFITNGQVHDFQLRDRVFQHQEYRPDSIALNEFAFGYLETIGIRCDSEIESAYEYLKGIVGENVRRDRKPMVCKSGGVPCGGRCLPEGQKCRKGVGGAIASTAKRAVGAVKTKGTVGNKLAKAALIGAGVVAGGKVLGKAVDELHTEAAARLTNAVTQRVGLEPIEKHKVKAVIRAEKEFGRESRKSLKEINHLSKKAVEREGVRNPQGVSKAIDDLDTKVASTIGTHAINKLGKEALGIDKLVNEEDFKEGVDRYKAQARKQNSVTQKMHQGSQKGAISGLSTKENERVAKAAERIRASDLKRRAAYKKHLNYDPGAVTY